MRLLARDLRRFTVYEPALSRDADGDLRNSGGYEAVCDVEAHLQPVSEKSVAEEFGVGLRYMAQAFTTSPAELREGWYLGEGAAEYRILTIEKRRGHKRLYLRQVTDGDER